MSSMEVKVYNTSTVESEGKMGALRNGARTFLNVIAKACQLSRIPGFKTGLDNILGPSKADQLMVVWEPLCALVDTLIAADNYYNQVDRQDDDADGEDEGAA